jgi:CBS domain-containing protein
VVNEQRIVLGRLRVSVAPADGARRVEDVMEAGPATVRAHEPLIPLLERMARRQVGEIIVTTPEGELLGVVRTPEERSRW